MGSLSSINIIFNVDTKTLSTDLQNAIRDIKKWGDAMQDVGRDLTTYITAPLALAGGASIKFASDFVESQNKVTVAFKDSSDEVEAFAKTTLTQFGIAEGSALDMASGYGDMATSMGIAEKNAADMSKGLVGLAGDLSSFKNVGLDQSSKALTGIFTGETESLKMLGIVMTETNLAQFALSQGITKNIKDFTQAEKVQLRYAYVMEQTKNAQGDFARTGGGAANQMRVFQESLKELAVQIGQVILPLFTDVVRSVNGVLGSLKGMDEGWRTTIVVIGGVVAAIGPLVYVVGSAAKAYANFAQIAYQAAAALAANPITAVAVALGAVAAYAVIATTRFTPLTNAARDFDKVMRSGAESIAQESAELNKNIAIAKNKQLSDEQREKAIKALNALSPEYLGNLTLETINTDKATAAIDAYNKALIKRAQVTAAQEALVDVSKKLLDLQLKGLEAVKPDLWQKFTNAVKSGGNSIAYASLETESMVENLVTENKELTTLQQKLAEFINANEEVTESNKKSGVGVQEQIDALRKLQSQVDLNSQAYKDYQKEIDALQKLLTGSGPKKGTIDFYQSQIDQLQKLQTGLATTNKFYAELGSEIEKLQQKIDKIKGVRPEVEPVLPEDFKPMGITPIDAKATLVAPLHNAYPQFVEEFNRYKDEAKAFNEQFTQIIYSIGQNFAAGFGEVLGEMAVGSAGVESFWSLMLSSIADLAIQLGKMAIGIGLAVEGIKNALASLNPAVAVAAGVALVALGTVVKSNLRGYAGAFADGGIVGGSSYYGDKLFARVNSGEMILNENQQRNLSNMISPAGSNVNITLDGAFEIKGEDLELILERVYKKNNRKK